MTRNGMYGRAARTYCSTSRFRVCVCDRDWGRGVYAYAYARARHPRPRGQPIASSMASVLSISMASRTAADTDAVTDQVPGKSSQHA